MKKNLLRLMGALTLAAPVPGPAQDSGPARIPAPELRYESAFAGYTPYAELAPADWRAVNDAVGQAARDATPAAAVKPATPPAPAGMQGDRAHGAHEGRP